MTTPHPADGRPVDDCCEYVRAGHTGNPGTVHLAARVFLKAGRTAREAGEFLCSPTTGRSRLRGPAGRLDFLLDACPRCLTAAGRLGIDLGDLSVDIPGPRVAVFTTSPARRDRPYAVRNPRPVGAYGPTEVWRVTVPEDVVVSALRWYQLDRYHGWDADDWRVLVGSGRAAAFERADG